jgi:hypothetical protein
MKDKAIGRGWEVRWCGFKGVMALTSAIHAIADIGFDHVRESTQMIELGHNWWPNRQAQIQACQYPTPIVLLEAS